MAHEGAVEENLPQEQPAEQNNTVIEEAREQVAVEGPNEAE